MTELQLYKWIQNVECHYNADFTELWACPDSDDLNQFFEINSPGIFDDGGIDCKMCHKYIAIDLIPIAEYYGIEIGNVISKTPKNQ